MTRHGLRAHGPDIGVACASLIAAASLCRLVSGGLTGPAGAPFLAAAVTGSVVPAVLSSRRVIIPLRVLFGIAAVALVSLWTSSAGSSTFGVPTVRTWDLVEVHLRSARPLLRAFSLPLPSTQGVVLLGALLVGLTSVIASALLHSAERPTRLRPGPALLGPLALLTFACAQTPTSTVALPLVLFVAVSAATLSWARPTSVQDSAQLSARSRWLSSTTALTAAVMLVGALLALTLGAGAGTSGGVNSGGSVANQVPPTGLSLTSSLVALEVRDANVTLFRAHSPYATYWQVAILSDYRSGTWVAGDGTASAVQGTAHSSATPVQPSTPTGAQTFTSGVVIENFSSRLLPVPPATIAVSGAPAATVTTEGAVTARGTRPGQRYSTTSVVPSDNPATSAGSGVVDSNLTPSLRADVALPQLPTFIKTLAEQATIGAQFPLSQAEALVNWFRSGKFRYTLHPPPPAPGANPLLSFLTSTRTGTCEEFAGAFAVLARSLGLPTRVVVGFTAGHRTGPDEVTVRGADAHAWPQVYLGQETGWVSFEPTPQRLTGEAAPEGVIGPTGIVRPVVAPPEGPPPATGPTVPPSTAPEAPTTPTTTATTTPGATPASAGHRVPTVHGTVEWIVPSFAGVLLLAAVVAILVRRRRRSPLGRSPIQISELAESAIDQALRRAGAARPIWRPLTSHLCELTETVNQLEVDHRAHWTERTDETAALDQFHLVLVDAVVAADFAEHARYAPGSIDPTAAMSAFGAAERASRRLRNRDVGRLLKVAARNSGQGQSVFPVEVAPVEQVTTVQ